MRFQFDLIRNLRDRKVRSARVSQYISDCLAKDSPPLLSDLLVEKGGDGGVVLRALGEHQQEMLSGAMVDSLFRFKIKALRTEWGAQLKAGDKVHHKTLKNSMRKVPLEERQNAKRKGTYEKEFLNIKSYEIDKDGCFTCGFESAVHFLNNHGIHAISGEPLTNKEEVSRNVAPTGDGKGMRHIWYWLYQEVDQSQQKAQNPK